jgi:hypothetical protein
MMCVGIRSCQSSNTTQYPAIKIKEDVKESATL